MRALERAASHSRWAELAYAFRELGDHDAAIGAAMQALRIVGTVAATWHSLGVYLLLAGRDGEAEAAFRQALTVDPGHGGARFNLGVLLRASAPAEAADHWALLRRYDPDLAALLHAQLTPRARS